MTCFFD